MRPFDLDFRGAYIATNVNHRYYDSEDFDPFWTKAQALDVPVVMHPENPAGNRAHGLLRSASSLRQSRRHNLVSRHFNLQREYLTGSPI